MNVCLCTDANGSEVVTRGESGLDSLTCRRQRGDRGHLLLLAHGIRCLVWCMSRHVKHAVIGTTTMEWLRSKTTEIWSRSSDVTCI